MSLMHRGARVRMMEPIFPSRHEVAVSAMTVAICAFLEREFHYEASFNGVMVKQSSDVREDQ